MKIGPEDWDNLCFNISAIGEQGSEKRNHSDLFLGSIVEPALEEFKLKVVRADRIGKPGMITRQVVEYILRSRLVVADLSLTTIQMSSTNFLYGTLTAYPLSNSFGDVMLFLSTSTSLER